MLARDGNEQTFLHEAAKRDNTKEFDKLWGWATEKLSAEELRETLLAKDHLKHTVFNVAANRSNNEVFRRMWKCAREKLTVEEIQNLFTFRQQWTYRVDLGAKGMKIDVCQKLWNSAKRQ